MTGLWLSGLRLRESIALSWNLDAPFTIDLKGKHPAFRIDSEAQKSNRDELLPMTPDFAGWLLRTPQSDQVGFVFKGIGSRSPKVVGTILGRVGKRAGVVVSKGTKKVKYASAHDFRRAFGTRWAQRVMPPKLQRLMRHANIQTTIRYYVEIDTDALADDLWQKWGAQPAVDPKSPVNQLESREIGDTSGDTRQESTQETANKDDEKTP